MGMVYNSLMRIVITGASSGLGAALARAYACAGVSLALTGRDAGRLESVAADCRNLGAEVVAAVLDVTDAAAMSNWLLGLGPVDLAIANAGISAGTGGGSETHEQAQRIMATNVDGVLNTLHPLIPLMKTAGRGQLVIISSLAGFRGMPGAPAYSASKGAVRMYGEALRPELAAHGVGVTVICPGFIRTPMTDINTFPMPFLMEAEAAARFIRHKLARNPARIAFPLPLYWIVRLIAALPVSWADKLLFRLPKKPAVAKP